VLTGRLTYALADESVLVRGILGSPAPASMWTGWSWRTLHMPLDMVAQRFGFREIGDDEAERLISDVPELLVQAGDVAISLKRGAERSADRPTGGSSAHFRGEPSRA
jgi:hypothetical protein